MSNLIAARVQMGNSLAFHIVFVVLAIGMPVMLCIAEGLGLWHKDPDWMLLARRWSKAVLLIFIIGANSATKRDLEVMMPLVGEGKLRTVIDRVFELHKAADAHRYLEQGKQFGKVVLRVGH